MQRRNPRLLTLVVLVVLALLALTTACAVDPGAGTSAARPPSARTPAGSTNKHHGGGFAPSTQAPPVPSTTYSGSLPDSVDLSRFNPPVTDQDAESKCAATATGYYLRGWYAKRDGYYPASGFSDEFTYDQVPHDPNGFTTFWSNLIVQVTEGLDTKGDFSSGNQSITDSVSDAALTNAVRYKISPSFSDYRNSAPTLTGPLFIAYIKQQLASQTPLAIGIYTSPGFMNLNATSASDLVTDTSSALPGHALFAYGYDQRGLLVENEWGTGWGWNGYAELSWGFVATFGQEVASITPRYPTVPDWQRLPGRASAISVGAFGSVWSLGVAHVTGGFGIYHWDPRTWTWSAIPGGAVRLAVDPDGKPWIVNDAGNILHWDGTAWHQLPGVARDIAIDESGTVWMVSGVASPIHQTECPTSGCGTSNIRVAGVDRRDVAMPAVNCLPSPLLCDGSIYFWTGSAWQQMPGTANRLAVARANQLWTVSRSGVVSYYTGQHLCTHYCTTPMPTPAPTDWTTLPPPAAKALAVAPSSSTGAQVWEIGMDRSLFRWDPASNLWYFFGGDVTPALAIAAGPRGNPWVVNTDGSIYELPAWDDTCMPTPTFC